MSTKLDLREIDPDLPFGGEEYGDRVTSPNKTSKKKGGRRPLKMRRFLKNKDSVSWQEKRNSEFKSVKIGGRVFCDISSLPGLAKSGRIFNPVMVYEKYFKGGQVVGLGVMRTSVDIKAFNPSDLIVTDKELIKAMSTKGDERHKKISTDTIYTFPATEEYFPPDFSLEGELPESLWPDLLARRAQSLMFNAHAQPHYIREINLNDSVLVREGFTLGIPETALRRGEMAADVPG